MAASLEWRLTGGASNTDPDASLGGTVSSEVVSSTALNNLFDNVDPADALAGDVEYRAIQLQNTGDATAVLIRLWISAETGSSDSIIAVGIDSGTQSIADEDTAPDTPTITFTHPLVGSKMTISNIAAAAGARLWVRRTISASATNYANDTVELTVTYA